MSEWVDFGLYSLQAVLLWIVAPAWCASVFRPAIAGGASRLPGAGTLQALRAWGLASVLVLLAYRLDKVPAPLSARDLHRTGWETLLMTSNLLLSLGLLFAAFGAWRAVRWLKGVAATREPRDDVAFALSRDELLPRRLQNLAYALVLFALFARPLAGFFAPGRVHDVWGNFIAGLVLAALLFAAAAGSVMRAPSALDQQLGPRLRRLEVGLCYLLMANLALLEIAGLALELWDLGSRRHVALLLSGFVSATLGGLLLLSSRDK